MKTPDNCSLGLKILLQSDNMPSLISKLGCFDQHDARIGRQTGKNQWNLDLKSRDDESIVIATSDLRQVIYH